jgi:hypothetical protein
MRSIAASFGPLVLIVCFFLGIIALPFACKPGVNCADPANAASASCAAQVAVDCAGGDVQGAIAKYGPLVEQLIMTARNPDGSINWAAIETQLTIAALQYGACTLAGEFDNLINGVSGAGSGTGSGSAAKTSTPSVASSGAKDAFDRVRAKAFPGKTFKLASGRTL